MKFFTHTQTHTHTHTDVHTDAHKQRHTLLYVYTLHISLSDQINYCNYWLYKYVFARREEMSMLEKLDWFHLPGLIALVLLMWKWMCLLLRESHLLRWWGWISLLNWIGVLMLSQLLKLLPRKVEPWFSLWSFFLLRLFCIYSSVSLINLQYGHAWNTDVISGLVLLVATCSY